MARTAGRQSASCLRWDSSGASFPSHRRWSSSTSDELKACCHAGAFQEAQAGVAQAGCPAREPGIAWGEKRKSDFRFSSRDSMVTAMSQLFPSLSKHLLIFADALNKENERNVRF